MQTAHFSIKKLAQCEELLPGFAKIWKQIKADTGTSQRGPKSLTFTDAARPVYMNVGECGRRYVLNLETMALSGGLHMSSGEWACHASSNNDEPVEGLSGNAAIVTVVWHDYYRSFSIEIQVAKLPERLVA